MDFARLNTKTAAAKGAELHLRHPVLGHLLYSGDGCDENGAWDGTGEPAKVVVYVRGMESKPVQDELRRLRVARVKDKRDADMEESGLALVCALVIGFGGLTKDGNPMEPTEENKRAFFAQSDDLVEQVSTFAQDKANFFATGSTA
jgi:hypothetical protein